MSTRRTKRFVHEAEYVAEVEVDLIEDETAWSPYLSIDDVEKLDRIRLALRSGNLAEAGQWGKVYRLTRVAV